MITGNGVARRRGEHMPLWYLKYLKGDDCPSVSRLDGVQINADGEITYPIWCGHLTPGDFGKTVFLTREEAALRRERDEA